MEPTPLSKRSGIIFFSTVWVPHIVPELCPSGTIWSMTAVAVPGGDAPYYSSGEALPDLRLGPRIDWCTLEVAGRLRLAQSQVSIKGLNLQLTVGR